MKYLMARLIVKMHKIREEKYLTQVCNSLLIVSNHNQVARIFGDRTSDALKNIKLFCLKQKTLL